MTRAEFVERLMASGHSRNSANQIADKTKAEGRTYGEVYDAVVAVKRLAETLFPALSVAGKNATKASE